MFFYFFFCFLFWKYKLINLAKLESRFFRIIYRFNNKKLNAISNPAKITIIKLNPIIQFIFKIIQLKIKIKNIKIIINSDVKMVDNKLFIDKLKQISVNKLNIEKNFNQNNIVFNLYKCY